MTDDSLMRVWSLASSVCWMLGWILEGWMISRRECWAMFALAQGVSTISAFLHYGFGTWHVPFSAGLTVVFVIVWLRSKDDDGPRKRRRKALSRLAKRIPRPHVRPSRAAVPVPVQR